MATRDTRVDAMIPVRFADAAEFLVEFSANISKGGIFVRTSSPLPLGTKVRLTLELPGTKQSVPVLGQVAFLLTPELAARQGKVPGIGVRFTEMETDAQRTLAAFVDEATRVSRGRVLVVDDDVIELQAAATIFRRHSFNVVTASSAVQALEVVRYGEIDLIVSDLHMPRMDGFELRDNVRRIPHVAEVPFVFASLTDDPNDRAVAAELGVTRFLKKPLKEEAVLTLLNDLATPTTAPATTAATASPLVAPVAADWPASRPPASVGAPMEELASFPAAAMPDAESFAQLEPSVPPEMEDARRWTAENLLPSTETTVTDGSALWSDKGEAPAGVAVGVDAFEPTAPAAPLPKGDGTPMVCTLCGGSYTIGDEVTDERMLLACPACIEGR